MRLNGLRRVRQRLFLTQEDVAAKAGMSKSTVNRLEQGVQEARISTARRLAEALGVSAEELMEPSGGRSPATEEGAEDPR